MKSISKVSLVFTLVLCLGLISGCSTNAPGESDPEGSTGPPAKIRPIRFTGITGMYKPEPGASRFKDVLYSYMVDPEGGFICHIDPLYNMNREDYIRSNQPITADEAATCAKEILSKVMARYLVPNSEMTAKSNALAGTSGDRSIYEIEVYEDINGIATGNYANMLIGERGQLLIAAFYKASPVQLDKLKKCKGKMVLREVAEEIALGKVRSMPELNGADIRIDTNKQTDLRTDKGRTRWVVYMRFDESREGKAYGYWYSWVSVTVDAADGSVIDTEIGDVLVLD